MNTSDPTDPVHQEDGVWFFFDETWVDRYGPYPTEENARYNLQVYTEFLNEGYFNE